jgi:uncharacterized protein YjiS (DUF1127 family)
MMEVISMNTLLQALQIHAARRGDGLLPEFLPTGYRASQAPKVANESSPSEAQLVDGRPVGDFAHTSVLVTAKIDTGWSRHEKRRWRILVALAEFTTAWRRHRRDRRLLASLNERELRDLGIDRPMGVKMARRGYWSP